ncbi:MAG: 2-oxoacid:ferredoxin oxidoreductase subunit beta [Bacteroidetes Order II. Incertae sedis bacterium]|nr:2-oxoacid:ferredoxin oxidoreductase subunit beta [Bacteroidetes Order II. bacterium]MBT6200213.1 2-oxoacid:ferredoxin oxidoreductase subunit beta [Bacteroidetes Order II. bacterium]MBT6598697.1 2-oxoacid:ferredoxin oxidoreductase subunit beta [Bacteroidetes Order II. bacterium]
MAKSFEPGEPIWCAGCGHFGVQNAVVAALAKLEIPSHETLIISGIGCSGTLQNNVSAYGYHALHGRLLPTATGAHLANRDLTVIASGGDGDGYAIGMGHLVHAFRRNPSFVYVLMNNGTYGLTKGQDSPTAEESADGEEAGLDGIALGVSLQTTTFLARGYSGNPAQLVELMIAALKHSRERRGFSFLEVLSPCVTYNDTYSNWAGRILNVDDDLNYDRGSHIEAFKKISMARETRKILTGLIFEREVAAFTTVSPPALIDVNVKKHLSDYQNLLERYVV